MRKALFLAVIVGLMVCGSAIAADKIGTFGAPNASGTYPMEVTDDRAIAVASDATFTLGNDLVVTDDALVSGDLSVTGNLAVTGTIVDASIYTKAAGAYTQRLATVGADGTIYGTRTSLRDAGIYSATAGTGAARALCISLDGTIYGSATKCVN